MPARAGRIALQDQVVEGQRLQRGRRHGVEGCGDQPLHGLCQLPKGVRLGDREADVEVLINRALPLANNGPGAAEGEVRAGLDEGQAFRRCQQRQYRGILVRHTI